MILPIIAYLLTGVLVVRDLQRRRVEESLGWLGIILLIWPFAVVNRLFWLTYENQLFNPLAWLGLLATWKNDPPDWQPGDGFMISQELLDDDMQYGRGKHESD